MKGRIYIDGTNDAEEVKRRLDSEPQLCMVLTKDLHLDPIGFFNVVNMGFVFAAGKERYVILCGGYKADGELEKDPEKVENTFGRQVDEQIHDEIIEIEGTPYILFCETVDTQVVEKMRMAFDIQEIEYDSKPRKAIRGHYYDPAKTPLTENKVISQLPPIYNSLN